MPLPDTSFVNADTWQPMDHLREIFSYQQMKQISAGDLERYKAIERELRALATEIIGPDPTEPTRDLDRVLLQGSVLRGLFELVR